MRQRRLAFVGAVVGTIVGISAVLLVTMPRRGSPEPQAITVTTASSTSSAPTRSVSPMPPDWVAFTSTDHGYSIKHPSDWEAYPASRPDTADYLESDGGDQLWAVRRSASSMAPVDLWADEFVPKRASLANGRRRCTYSMPPGGTRMIPVHATPFRSTEILGRPAAIRSLCSYVDAVIDLDDGVLVLTYRSPIPMPSGDGEFFNLIIAGLRLAEDR